MWDERWEMVTMLSCLFIGVSLSLGLRSGLGVNLIVDLGVSQDKCDSYVKL